MKNLLLAKTKFILFAFFLIAFLSPSQAQIIQQVKDLRTGNSFPFDFTVSGTKLFFIASDDVNVGAWVTDGTAAGTQKLTPSTGPLNSISDIVAYNNKVYFSYDNGITGYELWVSDGTVAGTGLVSDLYAGSTGSFPRYFTVANNKMFFIGDKVNGDKRLFVSDGTAAGTFVVKDNYITLFNGLATFAILNNDIYFTSDNGTGSGYGLWKSNGTLAGTQLVLPDLLSTSGGNYAVLNNKLYFNGFDNTNGSELWVTDGTTLGTHIVINLRADGGGILYSGSPFNMIVFKNKIYFTASDDTHGAELFSSDGTAAGTQIVKDMEPGIQGSVPQQSVIYNGNLYFSCYSGNTAVGLWKSDGTTAGTTLIKQGGGNDPFFRDTRFAPVFNGKLYFIVNDLQYYPLWETDGTSAGTKVANFQNAASPAYSTPINGAFDFALYNSELYFAGTFAPLTGFSWGIEPTKITNGTLPLTWLGVQAQWINGSEANVSWQVAEQKNVKDYTVQYSSDGNEFLNVCSAISAAITSYNCIVPAHKNTKNYYRVIQTDIGKITYSKIVLLQASAKPSLSVYPNPAKDKLYIQGINNFSEATISDAGGKIINHTYLNSGSHYLDVSRLIRGVYFVKLESGNNTQTIKFNKE